MEPNVIEFGAEVASGFGLAFITGEGRDDRILGDLRVSGGAA